jgi:hypothetical protein
MAITSTLGFMQEVGDKERKRIKELYTDTQNKKRTNRLTEWEQGFVNSLYQGSLISTHRKLYWTPKQVQLLVKVEEKYYAAG